MTMAEFCFQVCSAQGMLGHTPNPHSPPSEPPLVSLTTEWLSEMSVHFLWVPGRDYFSLPVLAGHN